MRRREGDVREPVSVFFFQAEDGIRDVAVTGVQTCALPISQGRLLPTQGASGEQRAAPKSACALHRRRVVPESELARHVARRPFPSRKYRATRSEERRVGKEGRSRWSPYH